MRVVCTDLEAKTCKRARVAVFGGGLDVFVELKVKVLASSHIGLLSVELFLFSHCFCLARDERDRWRLECGLCISTFTRPSPVIQ